MKRARARMRFAWLGVIGVAAVSAACPRSPPNGIDASAAAPTATIRPPQRYEIAQMIYDGALKNEWGDWGWSDRDVKSGGPAKLHFVGSGNGWVVGRAGLKGDFGALVFRVKTPPGEAEFLEVRVESAAQAIFPRLKVAPDQRTDVGDGWSEVYLPIADLDPEGLPFDRIVFHAFRDVDSVTVLLDKIALTKGSGAARPAPSYDPATLPRAPMAIDCRAKPTKISPMIYGIASYPFHTPERQAAQWLLGATARRWGGNATTTYNFEISAWNSGLDWFYENGGVPSYAEFIKANTQHGMASVVTVPMMGWVSKDKTSFSFPVSVFGAQEATDGNKQDAGNGKDKSGKPIPPGPPTRSYMAITPEYVKRWIKAIRAEDAKTGKRSVWMYILDNEPALWNTGHRDAHPEPLTYDELLQRTIEYGTAVREADPEAVIAGPAEWGWTAYFYSAKDSATNVTLRPDRRAHGDMPILAWYLKQLAEHEKKTGVRILDVLDVHAYPQGEHVYGEAADAETAALRLRQTRMLWDPTYTDESWIKEPVRLLPRLREWVDSNYPGRGISLGEWNFGGESHMSGGLAIAETLGRFAQAGLTSAFYWVYPPESSPGMYGFRAYRNFDGKGGRFLDWSMPTAMASATSLFASRDEQSGSHIVAVALNLAPKNAVTAHVDLSSCGALASYQAYSYVGGQGGFMPSAPAQALGGAFDAALPPYSITVFDIHLNNAGARTDAK